MKASGTDWELTSGTDRNMSLGALPEEAAAPIWLYAGEHVEYPATLSLDQAIELLRALEWAIHEVTG